MSPGAEGDSQSIAGRTPSPFSDLDFSALSPLLEADAEANERFFLDIIAEDFSEGGPEDSPFTAGPQGNPPTGAGSTNRRPAFILNFTADLLELASQQIGSGPGKVSRADFAHQHKIPMWALRLFVKADGNLTVTGQQRLAQLQGTLTLQEVTPQLLELALQEIGEGPGRTSLSDFATKHSVSYLALRRYIDRGCKLKPRGELMMTGASEPGLSRLTPELLQNACQVIGKGPNQISLPQFAKEKRLPLSLLRAYVKADGGLTFSGKQRLERCRGEAKFRKMDEGLLKLASQSIGRGPGKVTQTTFAQQHGLSLVALRRRVRADGTIVALKQKSVTGPRHTADHGVRERINGVNEAAKRLLIPGEWNFPHADQLFTYAFGMFAHDYGIRFRVETPRYSIDVGDQGAPFAGVLHLNQGHYTVRLGDAGYDVPPDGDCAFHAMHLLRLHAQGYGLGEYVVGARRPDGLYQLSLPESPQSIRQTIGAMRIVAAEHAMRNAGALAETIASEGAEGRQAS